MSKILFVDNCCPKPYKYEDLETTPMGGTEATVLRISQALKDKGYDVAFLQHGVGGMGNPDHVITLRNLQDLPNSKSLYPKAKHYLWLHDLAQPGADTFLLKDVIVLCVSLWHARQAKHVMNLSVLPKVMYNPVQDSVYSLRAATNPDKLVYFSSPHKGLQQAVESFLEIRSHYPLTELYIANPGYIPLNRVEIPGIVNVGAVPHSEVLRHVADSFCVLYPNQVFPETFGLVFAEANALGVPVATYDLGAATEVLYHPAETWPTRVVDRVLEWKQSGKPDVKGKEEFKMSNVIKKWERLFR